MGHSPYPAFCRAGEPLLVPVMAWFLLGWAGYANPKSAKHPARRRPMAAA
jgi:hypothetical protein